MRAQIEQVGENIKAALEAAGATLADIVKTTTYVTDMDEYFKHQDMRMRYFARCAADQHHRAGGAAVAAGVHGRDRGVRDRFESVLRCSASNRSALGASFVRPHVPGICRAAAADPADLVAAATYLIGRRNDSAVASCCALTSV